MQYPCKIPQRKNVYNTMTHTRQMVQYIRLDPQTCYDISTGTAQPMGWFLCHCTLHTDTGTSSIVRDISGCGTIPHLSSSCDWHLSPQQILNTLLLCILQPRKTALVHVLYSNSGGTPPVNHMAAVVAFALSCQEPLLYLDFLRHIRAKSFGWTCPKAHYTGCLILQK